MRRDDFCVFILSHGRADNVMSERTLRRSGYTGRTYVVVDDLDGQVERYRENFGADRVLVFDKRAWAAKTDSYSNQNILNSVVYARNAVWDFARELKVRHFCVLDDDYSGFYFRWIDGDGLPSARCKDLDEVFSAMVDFLDASRADVVCMAQAGDYVGGMDSTAATHPLLRKAMNVYFFATDRPYLFAGTMNDDVNTYVLANLRGRLVLTLTSVSVVQKATQQNAGGLTDMYLEFGTYQKSFYSVMAAPSCVRVSMLHGGKAGAEHQHWRIHHHVKWANCAPKILSERWRKAKRGKRR